MIIKKYYDEKEKADEVWYDSSMIYYTKFVEDENENKGNLFVTFKNGTLYVYKSVAYGDYLVFKNGGTSASSQGKALNSIIKPMYEYENLGSQDMESLKRRLDEIVEMEKENEDLKSISVHPNFFDIIKEPFATNEFLGFLPRSLIISKTKEPPKGYVCSIEELHTKDGNM